MIALGCLLLLILPILGIVVGGLLGGADGALWAAIAGLVVAVGFCGLMAFALVKAGRRR